MHLFFDPAVQRPHDDSGSNRDRCENQEESRESEILGDPVNVASSESSEIVRNSGRSKPYTEHQTDQPKRR